MARAEEESIKDINEVVPMSEGIAQHLKLTPMKTLKALTSAMKKMKMREENKEDEKEKALDNGSTLTIPRAALSRTR